MHDSEMEIEKECLLERSINRDSDLFASSSFKADYKSPNTRLLDEIKISPFQVGFGSNPALNHHQGLSISSSAICHMKENREKVAQEDFFGKTDDKESEMKFWDTIDKPKAFKTYKSTLYKFRTALLAIQTNHPQNQIVTRIERPSQMTIKKDILILQSTISNGSKDEFVKNLPRFSNISSLLINFVQQSCQTSLKIHEDQANQSLNYFLISPTHNSLICEYTGKIFDATKEAIALILFRRLNPIFLGWIKQHSPLKDTSERVAIDIDMVFITDEAADRPNLISINSTHQLTTAELEHITQESKKSNEEMRFHPKFTLKVFDLPPSVLCSSKSIEENILAIFREHFKMNVHFVFESSKQLSRIRFCEDKNPLITYQVSSNVNVNHLKTKVCKAILKFVIKNDAFDEGNFGLYTSSPQKTQSFIQISYLNHSSPISLVSSDHTTTLTSSVINQDKPISTNIEPLLSKASKSRSKSKAKSQIQRNSSQTSEILDEKARRVLAQMMRTGQKIYLESFSAISEILHKLSTTDLTTLSFHAIQQQKSTLIENKEIYFLFALLIKITLHPKFSENRIRNVEFFCLKTQGIYTFKASYSFYPFTKTESLLVETENEQQTNFEGKLSLLKACYPKYKSVGKIVKHMHQIVKQEVVRSDKNPFSIGYNKSQNQSVVIGEVQNAVRTTYDCQQEIAKIQRKVFDQGQKITRY